MSSVVCVMSFRLPEMLSFIGVALLVIVAPGPDFALTVRNTVRGGGLATAAGVASGQVAWALATAAGVSALLVASHPAFVLLRVAGAAYLIWLGVATLLRRKPVAPALGVATLLRRKHVAPAPGAGRPYRQGVLSNLGNPKMPVFFTSLLPQFGTSFAALAVH